MTTPHARRSLKAYSCFICPIAAFSATSSTRFFGSPTAMLPCPDSDPLPASSVACSRLATASLPAPGSHPSRRTCVSPAPHPPPLALLRPASRRRSSALPCACSETCLFHFLSLKSYSISCGVRGHIWTHPACKSLLDVARENETRTYIRPLSEEWVAPRAPMESALLLLIRSTVSNCGPAPPQVLKKLVSATCAIFGGSSISMKSILKPVVAGGGKVENAKGFPSLRSKRLF